MFVIPPGDIVLKSGKTKEIGRPIKIWSTSMEDVEEGTLEQAIHVANLPFIHSHIALMSDHHRGFGICIGGVMATKGVIVPNAVGSDIGCGMCSVRTPLTELNEESIKKILGKVRSTVPVGFEHHKEKQDQNLMPIFYPDTMSEIIQKEYASALRQIGTLGGGNRLPPDLMSLSKKSETLPD